MIIYKTRAAVLEALADGRRVKSDEVSPRVLRSHVWVAGSGSPGCLYDYGPNYHVSAADAVADLLFVADIGDGAPRGMRAELMRSGSYYADGTQYQLSWDVIGSIL